MYQVAHIGLNVQDVDKSMAFYQKVFGCNLVEKYEDDRIKIIFASCGNNVLEFVQNKLPQATPLAGVVSHIAFNVEKLEEQIKRIKELGVKCISEEPRDFNGGKIFFFEGPDGERLEFVESKSEG